jgi:hypothetical protein
MRPSFKTCEKIQDAAKLVDNSEIPELNEHYLSDLLQTST